VFPPPGFWPLLVRNLIAGCMRGVGAKGDCQYVLDFARRPSARLLNDPTAPAGIDSEVVSFAVRVRRVYEQVQWLLLVSINRRLWRTTVLLADSHDRSTPNERIRAVKITQFYWVQSSSSSSCLLLNRCKLTSMVGLHCHCFLRRAIFPFFHEAPGGRGMTMKSAASGI